VGVPRDRKLAERHEVLGIGLSRRQVGPAPRAENRALVARHLEVVVDDLVTMHEPDPATFQWVLARKG
jgi:hypothetical protein